MKKRSFNVISARRPEQISMRPSARRFPSFITSTQWNTFSSARNIVIIWLKYPQPKAPRPLIRANYSTVLNCWFQDSRTKESKSRSREQRADKASSLSLELLAHDRRTFLGPNLPPPTDRTNERTTKGRASNQVPFFFRKPNLAWVLISLSCWFLPNFSDYTPGNANRKRNNTQIGFLAHKLVFFIIAFDAFLNHRPKSMARNNWTVIVYGR